MFYVDDDELVDFNGFLMHNDGHGAPVGVEKRKRPGSTTDHL